MANLLLNMGVDLKGMSLFYKGDRGHESDTSSSDLDPHPFRDHYPFLNRHGMPRYSPEPQSEDLISHAEGKF